MRIVGLDPGSHSCGFAVIEGKRVLEAGALVAKGSFIDRLFIIDSAFRQLLREFQPIELAGVEAVQFHPKKPMAIIPLTQLRGCLLLALRQSGIPITEPTATSVKAIVTGNGQAKKTQVRKMVEGYFHLDLTGKPFDVSDALAVAYVTQLSGSFH